MADATLGRLQASLAAATNDVTVAAANLNFDFCLVKYEAPAEYHPLGELLSTRRKNNAENGKSHVTARRLAALFEGACPPTPKLVRAYGQRVSEISKEATDNAASNYRNSIFGAYAGVDATSIWAAATSSKDAQGPAIQVHLLACMLASMWDASEAISIWVEVVQERRRKIASDLENGATLPFSLAAAAAQQHISRTQLAEWDASARAWIQTADSVMFKKQSQLKLILKNSELVVSKDSDEVYPSVMEAWRTAMMVMENLISGIPQEVQDGTALLSLQSWHLFDIHVFGSRIVEVRMDDPLVALGGILSLGCSPSATTPRNGISWSLSLSHLRYYGYPVRKEARLQDDPSKLSVAELRQVVLGCVLERWHIGQKKQQAALEALHKLVSALWNNNLPGSTSKKWCQFVCNAIGDLRNDSEMGSRLLALGRKRQGFLSSYDVIRGYDWEEMRPRSQPFFGLVSPQTFLGWLKGPEERIAYLRRVTARHPLLCEKAPMIRYNYNCSGIAGSSDVSVDFATAFPFSDPASSQGGDGGQSQRNEQYHRRWKRNAGDESSEVFISGMREYLSYSAQLSIISYFVTGGCNITESDLPSDIMAMSAGDSIFVPDMLLQDPSSSLSNAPRVHFTRILGNVGQPGFVIFSSVRDPIVPPLDPSSWRLANQHNFDGKGEDTLGATSMHLSFTNWEVPLSVDNRLQGNRDSHFTRMECVVSIRDGGHWVADVDVLRALRSSFLYWLPPPPPCALHSRGEPPFRSMASVECWDELRDPPAGIAVVRCHGNWVARLAATCFLAQCAEQKSSAVNRVTLCPDEVCWRCLKQEFVNNVYIY